MLVREQDITEEFIARTLRINGLRATIHRDEDALLNKHGFAKRMPSSYRTQSSAFFQDPLARYKEAGLFEGLVPLFGNSWYPVRPGKLSKGDRDG